MLVCGLDINYNGAGSLVILKPLGEEIAHVSRLEPPLEIAETARWIRETARQFAPEPLWIAVTDVKWHWLDALGTLPVRWIHYFSDALCGFMPNWGEEPANATRDAVALARALNADLKDLRLYHQEMLYLSIIRDCAQRLTEILPRTQRFHPFLRDQLDVSSFEEDHVPF